MFSVMIVDDMDIMRKEIKRFKIWGENTGFYISNEAKNGQDALIKLENSPADLVITDIKMPKVDGIELLRKITEKNLSSCVVLLSDYSEFSYAQQGLKFGAFDYLVKPADEQELKKLLVRAREFLVEKKKKDEIVKSLEEKLVEKVEIFFPISETQGIIAQILRGDSTAGKTGAQLVDSIGITFDNDFIRIIAVLKGILNEVARVLKENEDWLNNYIDMVDLLNPDFSECRDLYTVKEIFCKVIGTVTEVVFRLKPGSRDNSIINAIYKHVLYSVDGEISVKAIADAVFMNKTYISEVFKQKTGFSILEYITLVKMERAKKLIMEKSLKTYEIAAKLGFKDVEYFSKVFRKVVGLSPAEYRKYSCERN